MMKKVVKGQQSSKPSRTSKQEVRITVRIEIPSISWVGYSQKGAETQQRIADVQKELEDTRRELLKVL